MPVFFHAGIGDGADLDAVAAELAMAAAAGIHDHILAMPLPWGDGWEALDRRVEWALAADPGGNIILQLDLNPPPSWHIENPSETASTVHNGTSYPSIASRMWIEEAMQHLQALEAHLRQTGAHEHIAGCVLSALEQGRWFRSDGYDRSEANTAAFRLWLRTRYGDDGALRTAWDDPGVALQVAEIPPRPDGSDTTHVFFELPGQRPHVDFLNYLNEQTAAALVELVGHARRVWGPEFQILLPYGHAFDLTHNDAGHAGLATVLESPADAFVSPISYVARGLGEVGGVMGPVQSALARGKDWYILDDTRTGIRRNPASGAIERPQGLRLPDLANLYRRNCALAALQGLRLAWSDPAGIGNLHDPEIWEELTRLRVLYSDIRSADNPPRAVDLLVVLDEESRFYQQCDLPLNELLLTGIRDTVLRAGVSVHFVLLRDVLQGKVPPASVYLFSNAFHLTREDREGLHGILAAQGAAAIWVYASGYIDETASAENIAATTRMAVRAFEEPAPSGSTYTLTGNRIAEGRGFGAPGVWSPLFYIEDEEADTMAHFTSSKRTSVAIKFVEEGWGSVYIAEPIVPLELLQEILGILDIPLALRETAIPLADTVLRSGPHLLLHAGGSGNRLIDFGGPSNIADLFDARIGWSHKQRVTIAMETGETRLFRVEPFAAENPPPMPAPATEETGLP